MSMSNPLSIKPNHSELESEHVHQVYEKIAQHFSQTRYKVTSNGDIDDL
jgi:hypothetical protein